MSLGPWEIGLIVVLVLIIFGVGKLPQIGDAIGKTIKNIRHAQSEELDVQQAKKTTDMPVELYVPSNKVGNNERAE
jgi:sec-independent protein translocase protein TatA